MLEKWVTDSLECCPWINLEGRFLHISSKTPSTSYQSTLLWLGWVTGRASWLYLFTYLFIKEYVQMGRLREGVGDGQQLTTQSRHCCFLLPKPRALQELCLPLFPCYGKLAKTEPVSPCLPMCPALRNTPTGRELRCRRHMNCCILCLLVVGCSFCVLRDCLMQRSGKGE